MWSTAAGDANMSVVSLSTVCDGVIGQLNGFKSKELVAAPALVAQKDLYVTAWSSQPRASATVQKLGRPVLAVAHNVAAERINITDVRAGSVPFAERVAFSLSVCVRARDARAGDSL